MEFTHFDKNGNAWMVDVGHKDVTDREAKASGFIYLNDECYQKVISKDVKKGDVLTVAQVAGIMACKKCSELIPLCHPIALTKCSIDFKLHDDLRAIEAICICRCTHVTGVEMEAITGTLIALETIYDMCKAIDKGMVIGKVRLLEKTGGKSGHYQLGEQDDRSV